MLKAREVCNDRNDRQAITIQVTLELESYEEMEGREASKGDGAI